MKLHLALAAASFAFWAGAVLAHGGHAGFHMLPGVTAFGEPAGARKASRVLDIALSDSDCGIPGDLAARQGDVMAFVVRNSGQRTSELVIGALGALADHARQYAVDPDDHHERHAMLHVAPGQTGILVWRFTRVGMFEYGCIVAGELPRTRLARVRVHR